MPTLRHYHAPPGSSRGVNNQQSDDTWNAKTVAHVPGMIYQFRLYPDGSSCFPFATSQIEEICGATAGEVREDAFPAFARVHPEDLQNLQAGIRDSAATMRIWRSNFRFAHPSGRVIRVHGEASPERLADGSVLWHGYMADVTSDYEAAADLRLAKAIIDNNLQSIMVTDAENRIVSVNPAFEKITGYGSKEVIGRNPRFLASGTHDLRFYRSMWARLQVSDSWSGEILNRRKSGELFTEWLTISLIRDTNGTVLNHVAVFTDISEKKAAAECIHKLAYFDPLTGLANRRMAEDRLETLIALAGGTAKSVAIIFLDLDNFKIVNDTYGHRTGDAVLIKTARRLSKLFGDESVLARLGGDEFAIGIGGLDDPEMAMRGAERIVTAFATPIVAEGREFHVSASLGIAMYPDDAIDIPALMQYADQALYAAKRTGRGGFRFFSPGMHRDVIARAARESALRRAVADDAFEFVFQPQVDLKTGVAVAAETLIRARDAALGGPAAFIPLAEEMGLIDTISDLSLRAACRQARHWRESGSTIKRVAVNVSARQFSDPELVEKIVSAIAAEGLPPEAIEIEITETAAMADARRTIKILTQLKSLGVETAIDDFGTGYSSLAYLRNFPLDRIKIDRAFISGIETSLADIELVRAVVSLARSLGLETLAEGVETVGQKAHLCALGCDMAQGYLFGRPRSGHALAAGR